MKLPTFLIGFVALLVTSNGSARYVYREDPDDSADPPNPGALHANPILIDVDDVQPFPQPRAITDSQKSALVYKPRLYIKSGCHPYPAVQANGSLSDGLQWKNFLRSPCPGSPKGSQVYSRSDWYEGKWAIMYAWYLPRALDRVTWLVNGHRHYWLWVVVWTDSPDPKTSTLLATSMPGVANNIHKYYPPKSKYVIREKTLKVKSYQNHILFIKHGLELTDRAGDFQDLVTWEQMTDEARAALSTFHRPEHAANPPLQDKRFYEVLEKAYPFDR
uniref:NLP effector protein 10 n=1 Tax=Plasmopara viticola TaxID=143451 RepID=NLP10_PLAVT|nr:RecName: Full=NLP effector protein 10; AltName: Full=Nep1-like protein 10; Flags: Precursor [Plasmopara viticola]UVH27393.1 NEP1-like protein 10 [Plasmopara viticola]